MPTLKQISCSLELGPSRTKLKEYKHHYTDGGVDTYIAVPEADIPFSIHVSSSGYIAGGLAAFVFIDGNYQCNRNRNRLKLLAPGLNSREQQIDLHLRQREDNVSDKGYIGRDWQFTKLRRVNPNDAPDFGPDFTKDVGTIEVIVVRCQDIAEGPAFTAMVPSEPPYRTFGPIEDKYTRKPPTKQPSQQPSKAPSKAGSSKKASVAGSDMLGGLFGIFDGGGDTPGSGRYLPKSYPVEGRFSRRWDERPNLPFNEVYDARPYTMRGAYRHYEDPAVYYTRPSSLAGHFASVRRPAMGFGSLRQTKDVGSPMPMSPQSLPTNIFEKDRGHTPVRDGSVDDLKFIVRMSTEAEGISKLAEERKMRLTDLQQEAEACRADPELQLVAMKACRSKEAEVQKLDLEENGLMNLMLARVQRMDFDTWRRAREILVTERRLMSSTHPLLRQWRDPKSQPPMPSHSRRGSLASQRGRDDDWQELGEFQKNGDDWQRKKSQSARGSKASSRAQDKPNDDAWGAVPGSGSHKQASDGGGWGDKKGDGNNQAGDAWNTGGDGWNNNPGSKPATANNAWGNDNASKKSKSQNQPDDAWGGARDDTKSQSHKSKVQGWDDGSKNNAGGGWGVQSKKSQAGGGWSAPSAGKAATEGQHRQSTYDGSSTQLEPVIKPYWATWNQPTDPHVKPRRPRRDPYQYPALPTPVLPSDARTAPGVDYAVQIGRGADYYERLYTPEYMDSLDKPYAVFKFLYRSRSTIEKMIGRSIDTSDVKHAIKEAEKDRLMHTPKEEMVAEWMRMKTAAGKDAKTPSRPASKSATANDDWGRKDAANNKSASNNDWGKAPSKPASQKHDWGGGGGDDWANNDKKSQGKSNAGWGAAEDNNNAWDNKVKSASKRSQGNGGWGSQKAASNATQNHFGGSGGMQRTKSVPRDEGWAEAGW